MFITLKPTRNLPFEDISRSDLDSIHSRYLGISRKYLKRVVTEARKLTPVRSGRLKGGYRIVHNGRFPFLEVRIVNPVPYFEAVERGRRVKQKKEVLRGKERAGIRQRPAERTEGVRMLGRSVGAHARQLKSVENSFQSEFLSLIQRSI